MSLKTRQEWQSSLFLPVLHNLFFSLLASISCLFLDLFFFINMTITSKTASTERAIHSGLKSQDPKMIKAREKRVDEIKFLMWLLSGRQKLFVSVAKWLMKIQMHWYENLTNWDFMILGVTCAFSVPISTNWHTKKFKVNIQKLLN